MVNDCEFRSIWIPTDWDETRDLAYYIEVHGKPDGEESRDEHILNNVERCAGELGDVLDNAISYFHRKLRKPVPLMAMLLAEKIRFLGDIVEEVPMKTHIRARIVGDLVYCLWVDGQREKLLGWLTAPNAVFWLKPYGELADCLCSAAMILEETMHCEHPDYTAA